MQTHQSQRLDSLLGKIVRMTLDGKPVSHNPFYRSDDVHDAAGYIWAYGLRNPFGLKIAEDRIFVANNGPSIDRFLEVHQGENYLWNGSDSSIGMSAAAVLSPGDGVAHIEYYPSNSSLFPKKFARSFFLVVTGTLGDYANATTQQTPYILVFEYDFNKNRLVSVPKPFVKYRGSGGQVLVGMAFGPDGLYFAPLYPSQEKRSAIFTVVYDPDNEHPFLLENEFNPLELMRKYACFGCHVLNNQGGNAGPVLNAEVLLPRLQTRLNSEEYIQAVKEMDVLDQEPFASYKAARKEVMNTAGLEKVRLWMKHHILEPRFDNPNSQMPNLGLSEREALVITDHLLRDSDGEGFSRGFMASIAALADRYKRLGVWSLLPQKISNRQIAFFFFLGGLFVGGIALTVSYLILHRRRTRSSGHSS